MSKPWSKMSTDEKLEALRIDVNASLDKIEALQNDSGVLADAMNTTIKRLALRVFEIEKKLKIS